MGSGHWRFLELICVLFVLHLSISLCVPEFLYLTIWLLICGTRSDPQDFRDAVSTAARQSGKPVIEERLLNQILYYLPQLYELNQDLLRELQQSVAEWYNRILKKCF